MSTTYGGNIHAHVGSELHARLWDDLRQRRKTEDPNLTMAELIEYYLRHGMAVKVKR